MKLSQIEDEIITVMGDWHQTSKSNAHIHCELLLKGAVAVYYPLV